MTSQIEYRGAARRPPGLAPAAALGLALCLAGCALPGWTPSAGKNGVREEAAPDGGGQSARAAPAGPYAAAAAPSRFPAVQCPPCPLGAPVIQCPPCPPCQPCAPGPLDGGQPYRLQPYQAAPPAPLAEAPPPGALPFQPVSHVTGPQTGQTARANTVTLPSGAAAADGARREIPRVQMIPGEKQFLQGNYLVAAPDILAAFARGDLRGAFYARIIYEYGLDGRPPDGDGARRALDVLSLKFEEIRELARRAPEGLRPLYQTAMGLLYLRGRVPAQGRDLSAAAGWLEDAADEGFVPAMNLLAAVGCDPDPPTRLWGYWGVGPSDCFEWTRQAAEAGDTIAMANLSALYRTGTGTGRDPLMAVKWAHRAAVQTPPSARAQNDLGAFHVIGEAVSPDAAEARRWFRLAGKRYPLAAENLAGVGGSGFAPVMERNMDY